MSELDAARGVAALLVVLHHANYALLPFYDPLVLRLLNATPWRLVIEGRAPVVFFFVLSGYVLTLALMRPDRPTVLGWAARRSVRLLLPAAGSALLSAALYLAFFAGPQPPERGLLVETGWRLPPDPVTLLGHALLIGSERDLHLNVVLWSLVHEWRISLLMPLVLLFRGRVALMLGLAALLHTAAIVAGAPRDNVLLGGTTVPATAYFVLPFAAGAALALVGPLPRLSASARWGAGAVILAAAVSRSDLATIAASALIIVMVQGREGRLAGALRAPPLMWLGRVSYSLYLVHVPVMLALGHALGESVAPLWVAALGVAISLPAAAAFYRGVEWPSLLLSRKVGRRSQPRGVEGAAGVASG